MLLSMWDVFGDREAVISGDKRFTFKEFKERILRCSGIQARRNCSRKISA